MDLCHFVLQLGIVLNQCRLKRQSFGVSGMQTTKRPIGAILEVTDLQLFFVSVPPLND